MNPLCIFHSVNGERHCDDGFASALVFREAFGPKNVDLHPGVYQKEPPWDELHPGRDVYLVDFSYKRPVVREMLSTGARVVVLDHHRSAIRELRTMLAGGEIEGVLDEQYSGCVLAWRYLVGDTEPPELLQYVQDWDLGRRRITDGEHVTLALRSHPQDFLLWGEFLRDVEPLRAEGGPIHRYYRARVDAAKDRYRVRDVGGHRVPVVNVAYEFATDVAGELAAEHPECPFAATWSEEADGDRLWSLRSRGDFDVGAFANDRFGGGGHPGAAGFRVAPGVDVAGPIRSSDEVRAQEDAS